ncbi:MAG: dihydropteroate synthase [Gammaproteobacteria bacterium]|nr:dihydropteroate synthase [Gammaproteobacteria bacterium]
MGVLNVTPDSFSDGGKFLAADAALAQAERMIDEGADIIDIGGESTRPGADPVPVEEELRRVLPVIEALAGRIRVPISIDTAKPEVMRAAAGAGASLLNDVNAFRAEGAVATAAELGLDVCIMHMKGEPRTMQLQPQYDDVVAEVRDFLLARASELEAAGLPRERIIIDPGFGFGKTLQHNLALLAGLGELAAAGYPVLAGMSRKSMVGALLDTPVDDRLYGSIALATIAAMHGASILRVHDVRATRDALRIAGAVLAQQSNVEGV